MARRAWLLMGFICVATFGCFVGDIVRPNSKTPQAPPSEPEPPPEPPPAPSEPAPLLQGGRLMRRLTLDLANRLPEKRESQVAEVEGVELAKTIPRLISNPSGAQGLARLHRVMWGQFNQNLPGLQTLAEIGFPAAFDETTMERAADEIMHHLNWFFALRKPYSAMYSGSQFAIHKSLLNHWNFEPSSNQTAAVYDEYIIASPADTRPAAGILSLNSFYLHLYTDRDPKQKERMSHLFALLSCENYQVADAHTFADLNSEQFEVEIDDVAKTQNPCAACHGQWSEATPAFAGLADQTISFEDWTTYRPPETAQAAFHSGLRFSNLHLLSRFLGSDPRIQQCQILRLRAALLQREIIPIRDVLAAHKTLQVFLDSREDMLQALGLLATAQSYRSPVRNEADNLVSLYLTEGAHFLGRDHWHSILTSLHPRISELEFPDTLSPGSANLIGGAWQVPTNLYFYAVQHIVREASEIIVQYELGDHVEPPVRRVFTLLPPGSAEGATAPVITAQIQDLWLRFCSEQLDENDPRIRDLRTLWAQALANDNTAESRRQAWKTLLIALFLSPEFLMY